jgi:putative ATP-binding cassette transporter
MPTTPAKQKSPWRKILGLMSDYFLNSDEKLRAWLLLIGGVICVIVLVGLMAAFSWWTAGFWAVLAGKALMPFLMSLGQFSLILAGYVGVQVIKNHIIGKLTILWRNWLTKKIINELFGSENNYLELKRRHPEIDNIAQRIQEDTNAFVNSTLTLGLDLLKSVLTLGTFAGSLWIMGGPLAFALLGLNIVIPGYLVWVALIIAVVATLVTHYIGKSLTKTNQKAEQAEADLRQDIAQLNDDAETIAEEHAEKYYQTAIDSRINDIKATSNKKLNTKTQLVAFQNFYFELSSILPTILAAPLYFSGLIEVGELMQVSMSFTQVNLALSWFVDAYDNLSTYKANIARLTELQGALKIPDASADSRAIRIKERADKNWFNIKRLHIKSPKASSSDYIMRNLNLKLRPGEHTLITGSSGLGKSTLFKAISGTWKYGEGKIAVPSGKRLYFLPQKPTLPHDTLRGVLAYPEPVDTYTDEEYRAALEAVGGLDELIAQLDETRLWSKELSGGQQQRVAFARVLLKKPDWLFLDEATSALDEESEDHVYRRVKEMQGTTIVSIAHRSTVKKHHGRVLHFHRADAERNVTVEEEAMGGVGPLQC